MVQLDHYRAGQLTRPDTVSRSTSTPRNDRNGATATPTRSESPTDPHIRVDLWHPAHRRHSHERLGLPSVSRGLAVILPDWAVAEFEVTAYELFADGTPVAHFGDGSVQTFRSGEWIDVYRSRGSEMGQRDAIGLPQDG